jgi:hypothetical protein
MGVHAYVAVADRVLFDGSAVFQAIPGSRPSQHATFVAAIHLPTRVKNTNDPKTIRLLRKHLLLADMTLDLATQLCGCQIPNALVEPLLPWVELGLSYTVSPGAYRRDYLRKRSERPQIFTLESIPLFLLQFLLFITETRYYVLSTPSVPRPRACIL